MSKSVFTKNKLKIFFIFLLSAILLAIGAAIGLYYHFGHALTDSVPSETMRGKMLYGNSFTVQELVDDTQYPYAWLSAKTTQVEVYAKNEQGENVLTTEVLSFDAQTRTFRVFGVGEGVIRFFDPLDKTIAHSISFKTSFRSADSLALLSENYPQFLDDGMIGETELAAMQYLTVRDMQSVDLADVLTFRFENGNSVRILGNHVFFDATLKKYVTVNADNYTEFVGHEFLAYDESGSYARTKLVALDITQEYVGAYAIITAYYYNAITDDMITCTPKISVYELISSYILDDLTFDTEQFEKDVEEYGLYEYALFDEYLSEEQFEQLCAAYFKISEGKGYTTYEQTYALMVAYGYIYQ